MNWSNPEVNNLKRKSEHQFRNGIGKKKTSDRSLALDRKYILKNEMSLETLKMVPILHPTQVVQNACEFSNKAKYLINILHNHREGGLHRQSTI